MKTEEALKQVADLDVCGLMRAQESYGDSWKKRGGVGAFMMLARKWDRIENRVRCMAETMDGQEVSCYDIFGHIEADKRAEGIIDDIRDLRRYLMLVEAEMLMRGADAAKSTSRDNKS